MSSFFPVHRLLGSLNLLIFNNSLPNPIPINFISKRSNPSDEAGGEDETPPPDENNINGDTPNTPVDANQVSPPKRSFKPPRKLTSKETEDEAVICANLEKKIEALKKDMTDKTIIFNKLSAELFRMLGLFERLEKMEETMAGNQIVEAEQVVRKFFRENN